MNWKFTLIAKLCVLALALAAPPRVAAQDVSQESGSGFEQDLTVSYVIVPFTLFDSRGRPISNLKRNDFELIVEGGAVETDLFEKSYDAPISFTILLDGSGSMGLGNKMDGARAALESLFSRSNPDDDFSLFVFAAGEVRPVVPFTKDGSLIMRAIDKVKPFGKTALYDAIVQMPDQTILGTNGVRSIILLTDGLENSSRIDAATLRKTLEGVAVPVFPLGLRTPASVRAERENNREASLDVATLASLAGASGGRLAVATDPDRLDEAISDILTELRAQYIIGFTPAGDGDVRFRSVSLDLKRTVGFVRIRAGYRGGAPQFKPTR